MYKLKLSPETRAQLERQRREIARLYALTDQWLAAAILRLARQARLETPQHVLESESYDSQLIWGLVPELARRLGTVRLELREIDWIYRAMSDYELRQHLGYALANVSSSQGNVAWGLIAHEPCNGNPTVMAIDRLCAGKLDDTEDPLTRSIQSVCRVREKTYEGVWSPDLCL